MSKLVFKILKPSATFHGLDYNEKKSKKGAAILLHYDNFGLLQDETTAPSKKQMKAYMAFICSANKRIRQKQFHAILSCKGHAYSFKQLKSYALEIMDQLGYSKTPIAIYGHSDTDHFHLHIVTTRIGLDGKKILHHFEGKRANEIVAKIQKTDKRQQFNEDLHDALAYQFSTIAQFQLLMELKGYKTKKTAGEIQFFKYGSLQGYIPIANLQQKFTDSNCVDGRLKALIFKYKHRYSSKPISFNKGRYTTKNQPYRTELTEALYKKFGWQFVFFKDPKHDKPYGYTVIDHCNKEVYKGSDILPLHQLLHPLENTQQADRKVESIGTGLALTVNERGDRQNSDNGNINNPATEIDRLIKNTEFEAEKEERNAYDPQKRKGRYI